MRLKAALLACYLPLVFFAYSIGVNYNDPRYSLAAMIAGTADRPFVYRQLSPMLIGFLAWTMQIPLTSAALIFFLIAFLSFLAALRWLAVGLGLSFDEGTAAIALAGLLPLMLRINHIYDVGTLALTTAALGAMARGRWALYLALFAVSCLNRETTFLLLLLFVAHFGIPSSEMASLARAQLVIYAAIRALLLWRFSTNPGAAFEIHLQEQGTLMLTYLETTLLFLIIAIGVLARMRCNWPGKPILLRRAALLWLPALGALYLVFGYPFEFRVFFEAYPVVFLLAVQ